MPSVPEQRHSVSVVVTSYNYGRYLPEAAESVLSQHDVDVQLIIVDDASTDDTPTVTEKLGADPRVLVIRHDENHGQLPSVNEALAVATGEFVVKLDADDLIPRGSFARAVALFERHPDVALVYGRPQHFTGPAPVVDDAPTRSWSIWPGRTWLRNRCADATCVISQPEAMVRMSCLRQALPIREDLPHTFDVHLWLQLASMGDVGRVNGPAQGLYRVHDQSMQRTIHAGVLFDLEGRRDAYEAFFEGRAASDDDEALYDMARRRLASLALDRACRAYDRGRTATEPVDEYVAFARDTWPDAPSLPAWKALERRRAVGVERATRDPRFLVAAAWRRGGDATSEWRWQRTGEW